MNRRYTEGPTLRKILQTIWYQVNNGQEIYVIGHIEDDYTVRGGTGWGAEFAKLCNKPLSVFDQERDGWFSVDRLEVGRAAPSDDLPGHHAPAHHRHRDARARRERAPRDCGAVRAIVRQRRERGGFSSASARLATGTATIRISPVRVFVTGHRPAISSSRAR